MKSAFAIILFALIPNLFACIVENKLEYCEGNYAINKQGLKATIKELYDNGTALIKYPSFQMEAIVELKELGVLRGETEDGLKILDQVLTPYGEKAQIAAIYQDGRVALYTNNFWQHQVHPAMIVPRTDGCTADGFCAGDQIKNKFGVDGTIIAVVIPESKAFVSYDGQERLFKWSTSDLRK